MFRRGYASDGGPSGLASRLIDAEPSTLRHTPDSHTRASVVFSWKHPPSLFSLSASTEPVVQARTLYTPATDDDYDATLALAPALCRPLAADLGDLRPAAEVRAGAAEDRAAGLARLRGPVGERLASVLRERFEVLAAAGGRRAVLLEDGRWL